MKRMHELSVTEALLQLALKHAEAAEAARVTDVHVVIGQLSTVVDESVQFYWDLISAGTRAEGARLHFRRVPAALRCEDCGHAYAPGAEVLACPACGGAQVKVDAGEELYLEALEVDLPPSPP
jgi:hydrogenase nickel incorporation protein HypA/HybF